MTGALIGPWCARCTQKRATWADRLCATCGAEIELEVDASLDALAQGDITPKSITDPREDQ